MMFGYFVQYFLVFQGWLGCCFFEIVGCFCGDGDFLCVVV